MEKSPTVLCFYFISLHLCRLKSNVLLAESLILGNKIRFKQGVTMTLQQQQKKQKNKNKRRRTQDKRCRFKNILTNLDSKIFFSTFSLLKNIDMI